MLFDIEIINQGVISGFRIELESGKHILTPFAERDAR